MREQRRPEREIQRGGQEEEQVKSASLRLKATQRDTVTNVTINYIYNIIIIIIIII